MNASLVQEIENELRQQLNTHVQLKRYHPISGGSISQAFQLITTQGSFFLKYNDARQFPGMFEAEVNGLSLLRQNTTLSIPHVLCIGKTNSYAFLIMEFIERASPINGFWKHFGERLATLHQQSSHYFGLDHDNYIGSLTQSNKQHPDFVSFLIEERLEKQWNLLSKRKAGLHKFRPYLENLYKQLPALLPLEPPALLHGDLWSGNYLIDAKGKPGLIDPSVHYGHREADLAMTKLFGGFDEAFYDAYNATYPLAAGWEERIAIFQLYPLLVHANLFGEGYWRDVEDIIRRF